MNLKELEDKIIKKSNVLFDFYDIAVWVPWEKKEDVYYFGDEYYLEKDESSSIFHEIRKAVTDNCKNGNIDSVYDDLVEYYGVNAKTAEKLKEIEEKAFINHCEPWGLISEIYNIACQHGCKIYFINDSIYKKDTVMEVLKRCNYVKFAGIINLNEIKKDIFALDNSLYVGNHVQLFSLVDDCIKVDEPSFILRKNKSEELIKIACGNFVSYDKCINSAGFGICHKLVAYKYYDELINNWKEGSRCNSDPFFAGYYMLGMHVLGICKWIIKTITKMTVNRILFCARDGYILYLVYKLLREEDKSLPKAEYIQASRRALLPIIIKSKTDFYAPPGILYYQSTPNSVLHFFWSFTNLSDLYDFECFSLEKNIKQLKDEIEEQGFSFDKTFDSREEYKKFITFFLNNYYSKEKHELLRHAVKKYYKDLDQNDIIFDAGYSGKLAKAISDICPQISKVLYLYTDEECAEVLEEQGKINILSFYNVTPCEDNMFREYLIAENGPTCIGIKLENSEAIPVFDHAKFQQGRAIVSMHAGALEFVKDYIRRGYDLFKSMPCKGQELSLPFEGFFRNINDTDLNMFRDTFQDDYYTGVPMEQNWALQYKCMIGSLQPMPENIISKGVLLELLTRKNIKIAYWGKGKIYKRIRDNYPFIVPDIIIDNNVKEEHFDGIQVKLLDDIDNVKKYYFIIVNNFYDEICEQLKVKGLRENLDYIWYKYLF